jgi:hypothetical protein
MIKETLTNRFERLSDFDLDVVNAMKNFPENDQDCYLYLRGRMELPEVSATVGWNGQMMAMIATLASAMKQNEKVRILVTEAVRIYEMEANETPH